MAFFRKVNIVNTFSSGKSHFYKKRPWRIALLLFGVLLVVVISFLAYAYSTGSKIFENGISGRNLLKTLYGTDKLRGESDNRINILVAGMGGANHPGGMLADSLIVVSIQPKEKKAAMISIPRDLLVPIPGDGEDKINSAFATGYNDYINKNCSKKKETCKSEGIVAGSNLTSQTVSNILGIPIHYYVTLDFNGFEKIIDQLGGVDIYVDKAIYDPSFPDKNMKGYDPFRMKAGQQHMDGSTALKYARSRESTSDFDRAKRQQKVIAAVKEKAMKSGIMTNPQKLIDVLSTLGNSVKTNFSVSETKSFLGLVKDITSSNISSTVLSNGPDGLLVDYNNGTYYLKPKTGNFKEIQKVVQNIFNNSDQIDPVKIEILNGSSTQNIATKLSEILKSDNYNITNVANSKTLTKKTLIYDYTSGKQEKTITYLKNGLNASVLQKIPDAKNTVDISIILGDDYTGFYKQINN